MYLLTQNFRPQISTLAPPFQKSRSSILGTNYKEVTPILNISEGLLKGDILNGELRNDAEKKELCVKYVFHMINKGHINTALMKKSSFEYYFEQCIYRMQLSFGSLIRHSFKKSEKEKVNIALFVLYIYEMRMWLFSNSLLGPLSSIDSAMELSCDSDFTSYFSMQMKEKTSQKLFGFCKHIDTDIVISEDLKIF